MNILLGLIIGILLGAGLIQTYRSNETKDYEEIIAAKDDLIKAYSEYVDLIEKEGIRDYQKALDETLKQNIKLKKLLNGKGSKSY